MTADHTVTDVFDRGARTLAGISPAGASPPWETFADVAPALGEQVAMAFGSVMSRPGLDLRTRELLTVCMLATLGGCDAQVAFHVGGALRAGATAPEIMEALTQVSVYAGIPRALNAAAAARGTLTEFGVDPTAPAPRTVALAFLAAVDRGDWAAAGTHLAADATVEVPGAAGAGSVTGEAGLARLRAAIGHLPVHDVLTHGGLVLIRATAATGHTQSVVWELRVEHGRITAIRGYVGAEPPAEATPGDSGATCTAPARAAA
ncbi:carboxymuconolactone decarboxylase family protein [Krasilnikovia sp. M28-CT-15]|uniref:carboxymuconolactone decarboxylase family protein n=1 Tax=Krasilnikovia sp. M28-CT-15 TaxID=3373540 RepID=UPI003876B30F